MTAPESERKKLRHFDEKKSLAHTRGLMYIGICRVWKRHIELKMEKKYKTKLHVQQI